MKVTSTLRTACIISRSIQILFGLLPEESPYKVENAYQAYRKYQEHKEKMRKCALAKHALAKWDPRLQGRASAASRASTAPSTGILKCRNSFQIQTSKWADFSPIMVFSDLLRLSQQPPPISHMKGVLSLVEWFLSQLASG